MDTFAPLADRPSPELRRCDGAPWPSDDELQADAEWCEAAWAGVWVDDRWADVDDVWPLPDAGEPGRHPRTDVVTDDGDQSARRGSIEQPAPVGAHILAASVPGDAADPVAAARSLDAERDLAAAHNLDAERDTATARNHDAAPDHIAAARDLTTARDTATAPNPIAAALDPDARLGLLESVTVERHRAAAEEGRLIAAIVRDAAVDPTPWVGPDPTLDLARNDPRRRSVAAIRRDRVDLAERAAVAEIAVRLRMSEQTVRTRAAQVEVLQQRCPRIWRAFREGRTSERHAVETARLASSLPDDTAAWALFDEGATVAAVNLVPTKFAVAARALRERVHAESLETRHQRAARDRGVWMTAELDGMASLTAFLPADRARSIMSRLDRAARHLHAAADEDRTLAQLRADVLSDLVTNGSGADAAAQEAKPADSPSSHRPAATVVVTVPALTLLGVGDDPATLEGYGPIDLETARRLAGEARSWVRLLTHPVTGAPLLLDRQTYRVPVALRRWLGVTSPSCVFPGCNRIARDCDIDHLTAWAHGGATDVDNLAPECRHHHRMRHETRWSPTTDPASGALRWTSPLGATFDTDPPPF